MRPGLARRILRRTGYALLALVGLVAVLLASTYLVLHTDWGREQVRVQLQKTLAGLFVGKVSIGGVEGDVLGDVTLRHLEIDDAGGQPAVRADALRVSFALFPLVGQTVKVSRLRVEGLRVDGATRADGTINLAGLMKPQEKRQKPAWSVDLARVEVVDGALALVRPAPAESVHLDGFAVQAKVRLDRDGSMDVRADLAGRWRERGLPLSFSGGALMPKDRPIHVPVVYVALGGVQLAGRELVIDLRDPAARRLDAELTLVAPEETVARLLPTAKLHQDVVAHLSVHPGAGAELHAVISGAIGKSPVDADLTFDAQTKRVHGLVQTHRFDLRALSPQAVATLVNATFAVDAHQDEHGDLVLARAHLYADAHAADATTRADAHVDLVASGTVSKVANATTLALRGNVTARDIVHGTTRAKIVQLDVNATGLPARPLGHVHVEAAGVYDQDRAVGMMIADARSQPDRSIVLKVRSVPAPAGPWIVDIDAVAHVAPELVQVALGRHVVRTKGLDWSGQGGSFEMRPDRFVIAGLRTHLARGALAVDATYYRDGVRRGDLDALVAADHLDLAEVDRSFGLSAKLGPDSRLAGVVDARAQIQVVRGRYTASIGGRAQGLRVRKSVTPLDASFEAHVGPGRLTVQASLRGEGVGAFSATLDVEPPARLNDVAAWQKLERSSIRQGRVTLENLDLAAIERLAGKPETTTGRIDGELTLTASDTSGVVHVRNVQTPALLTPVDAELIIHHTGHGLMTAALTVNLRDVTTAHALAEIEIPARPFDFAEWMRFDADEIRGITFKVDDVVLNGRRSRLLGLRQIWHGRVSFLAQVDAGLRVITASLDVTGLRGGPLARPADLHLEARLDAEQLKLSGSGVIDGRPILGLDGHTPVGLPALLRDGGAALVQAPLVGRLSIDQLPLSALATADQLTAAADEPDAAKAGKPRTAAIETVNGRAPLSGSMNARVMILGTVLAPTGHASVVVSNVGGGDGGTVLRELRAEATYDGTLAHAQLNGDQTNGGKLAATIDVPVARAAELAASLTASRFDLGPLEHLAPVRLYGLAGVIDGDLKVQGAVVARDTRIDGHLKISGARLPLAAAVGTLRRATLDLTASNGAIKISAEGDVGDGHIELHASAQVAGLDPKNAQISLHVDQITLVNQLQPRIAGAIDVKLSKQGEVWHVDANVHEASLVVPPDKGNELHDPGAPSDMVFIQNGHPVPAQAEPRGSRITLGQRPLSPYLIAKVTITPTRVQSREFRGTVRGELTATIGDDGMAIDGLLQVARGDVDLFDRRYRIDRANLHFDGDADPVLDIRLIHDFPELTLYASVRGRLSKPVLDLTSEPGTYSQGQLLSFLLGGTPGADPGSEVQSAATGVASSLLSQKAGKFMGKFMPVDFDVMRFEAATAGQSAAVTIGKWVTRKLFVAYRRHLDARPDENAGEGELEYYLGKRVLIEATVGDRGYHGADLLWLRRW